MSDRSIRLLLMATTGISIYQAIVILRLRKTLRIGSRQFAKLHEMTDYFVEIIGKSGIELTEFDVIALTAINEDK